MSSRLYKLDRNESEIQRSQSIKVHTRITNTVKVLVVHVRATLPPRTTSNVKHYSAAASRATLDTDL